VKEIKAIVQTHILPRVMETLHELPHFPGATISDCQGQGRGAGAGGRFEATEASIYFVRRTKLEIFCSDEAVDDLVKAIQVAARTGNPGDGLILVADVTRVVRIRNGQEQNDAV
jgi:nitrogen regulatory protein P-II 1